MEGTSEHISASSDTADQQEKKLTLDSRGASDAVTASKDAGSESKPTHKIPVEYRELSPRDPVEINLRTLLQAGVHFGHQTARWSPTMAPYIYGSRNGIHIINLPRTVQNWEKARQAIVNVTSKGGNVLFVGTKKQAQDAIVEEARRSGSFYVSRRWLGGMLTNFQTIRKSIARLNRVEELLGEEEKLIQDGVGSRFTKKERLMMSRERDKLHFSLGGIRDMYSSPQLMFIVDIKREDIAIKEAKRLDIPVVGLVDTNCDPNQVTYPIPSNDDGTRAVRLFCQAVADAVLEGKKTFAERGHAAEADSVQSTRKPQRRPRTTISAANAGVAAMMGNVPTEEDSKGDTVDTDSKGEASSES